MVNLVTLPAELILTNRQISVLTQMNRVVSCKIIWNCLKHLTVIITGELGFRFIYIVFWCTKINQIIKIIQIIFNNTKFLTSNDFAGNCMFKVNNRNFWTRCEICLKLTIKIPERCHWRRSGVFIFNFERIFHLVLVFL